MRLDEAYTLENIVAAAMKCRRGVAWKGQVQSFHLNLLQNCLRLRDEVLSGAYAPGVGKSFRVKERGKPRVITSCPYRDRVVQRVLCEQVLLPAMEPDIIETNSAGIPGRGTSHALGALEDSLVRHHRAHGLRGGIMLFDFSKYFRNIDLRIARRQLRGLLGDDGCEGLEQSLAAWQGVLKRVE